MCACVFYDLQLFYVNFQRICIWRRYMSFFRTMIDVSYWHWFVCSKFFVKFEMEQLWLFYHIFSPPKSYFLDGPVVTGMQHFVAYLIPSMMYFLCCRLFTVRKIGKSDGNMFSAKNTAAYVHQNTYTLLLQCHGVWKSMIHLKRTNGTII